MLRRSQSANGTALLGQLEAQRRHRTNAQPKLRTELIDLDDADLAQALESIFLAKYGYPARPEQIKVVVHLIRRRTTFLLAGTGFGKSRVPELFYLAHDNSYAPIILSINPLDALGDDQVAEKLAVGLHAVNLTGPNCTQDMCDSIIAGKLNFIYVSPEVALKSTIFECLWSDARFQARLVLNVVDEAHMIYTWGLVESGKAKNLASHVRVQDGGVFRPSYGHLFRRFLSSDKVPRLLMSATCPPQAVNAILDNLKIDPSNVAFARGELTRPEIRILRRAFKRPLKASLKGVFPHHTQVPTDLIPPTLLYAGSQNGTLEFLQLINSSRGTPNETANAFCNFAQQYHATTGPETKANAVATYVAGTLAVLCCTIALGLGQNWKRVRRVIILGRQDPCNFTQMTGRCGRDGRRGLGILLVEHTRTKGKNNIRDFLTPTLMTDDDRMDALAITPVCLRVALAVDLMHGYIPLDAAMESVTEETERQRARGMADCDCSNCWPEEAEALWLAQPALTIENIDSAMAMNEDTLHKLADDIPEAILPPRPDQRPAAILCSPDDDILKSHVLETLVKRFEHVFSNFFRSIMTGPSNLGPEDYFGRDLAWDLAKNIDLFHQPCDLAVVLASKTVEGQFNTLFAAYQQWKIDLDTEAVHAEASARRRVALRKSAAKMAQSVEGALMASERQEAQKLAQQIARERAKQAEAVRKEAARAKRAQAKIDSAARLKAKKTGARAGHHPQSSAVRAQTSLGTSQAGGQAVNAPKRAGEEMPPAVAPKRQWSLDALNPRQDLLHLPKWPARSPHPSENEMFDPRLSLL